MGAKTAEQFVSEVLAALQPLPPLSFPISDSFGCVLAEDVVSEDPVPPEDRAAFDGYAVRAVDVAGASPESPVKLAVIADVGAGSATVEAIRSSQAARISAGGPMPAETDLVIPREATDGGVATVHVRADGAPGEGVRRAGSDCLAGQRLAHAGEPVTVTRVQLLAALGRRRVFVHPKPRVVVISVAPERESSHGEGSGVEGVAAHGLAAAVREAGGGAHPAGVATDSPHELGTFVEDHLIRADVLVVTGGMDHCVPDIVRRAVSGLGDVSFAQVTMTPGGELAFGFIGPERVPVFCLPGDPVASTVAFELAVRPAIRRLAAAAHVDRPRLSARCSGAIDKAEGVLAVLPAQAAWTGEEWQVTPLASDTVRLADLAAANALIEVPPSTTRVGVGDRVRVMLTDESAAVLPLVPAPREAALPS